MYYLCYDSDCPFNHREAFIIIQVENNYIQRGFPSEEDGWWTNFTHAITATKYEEDLDRDPFNIWPDDNPTFHLVCISPSIPIVSHYPELASCTSYADLVTLFPESFI